MIIGNRKVKFMTKTYTKAEAKKILSEKGLIRNTSAYGFDHGFGRREYWHFNDGTDVFLDHSATITPTANGKCFISDFTHHRKI